MTMQCIVCRREERKSIDLALVSGDALAAIARRFGVSRYSLRRHLRQHLSPLLVRAAEQDHWA